MSKRNRLNVKDILPWKAWVKEKPSIPGDYWLAYYEYDLPGEDLGWKSTRPEEPFIWSICKGYISGKYDIESVKNWPKEYIIWCGPLTPPAFLSDEK